MGMKVDRRGFLVKGSFFFLGSLLGLSGLGGISKAFASNPRIALLIDDIGQTCHVAREFLDLGVRMTFAVLPHLPHSCNCALMIHEEGHEVLLHQPMEPRDPFLDPGPGALYVKDDPEKIMTIMDENISSLPFVSGVNNHMGSRFTERQGKMREALTVIKNKELFFIDSLTSRHSTGYETARELDLVAGYRNIFLDHYPAERMILSQLCKLKSHACAYGHAIGIGHPYPQTLHALRYFLKNLAGSGISLVHVSEVLRS